MPDFIAKFVGHIDEVRRPEGFPKDVTAIGTYRAESNKHIAEIINNELMAFIQMQGMIIQLEPSDIIDLSKVNTEGRVFVPMHMISYIRTEIKNMTAMPSMVDTGELDKNGKSIKEFQMPDGQVILPS